MKGPELQSAGCFVHGGGNTFSKSDALTLFDLVLERKIETVNRIRHLYPHN